MNTQNDVSDRVYNAAADQAIAVGNRLADQEPEADMYDISDGLLAGAVQYWLYARTPCDNPVCSDCEPINTAEKRLGELLRFVEELARTSEYYHTPNDANAGRA